MNPGFEIFEGKALLSGPTLTYGQFNLAGFDANGAKSAFNISYDLLSKHIMTIGSIGAGKTNAIMSLIYNIKRAMKPEDVMLIFDTKGDYHAEFFEPGKDVVISADRQQNENEIWNIFSEINADERIDANIREAARTLFYEKISKSTSQPFFPNAAKDVFAGLLKVMTEAGGYNNGRMMKVVLNSTAKDILDIFNGNKMRNVASYISDPKSGQTQGVLAELYQLLGEVFVGNFAKSGQFSIRQFVRNKGARTAFIEYDLNIGSTLAPTYRLLFDLAIKESLGRKRSDGSVYFIIDEFSLIPNLQHIGDGVNFGRSLGAKFIIGLQNIDQMYEAYGVSTAKSILSGFSTILSFRLNDAASREHIKAIFGKNKKKYVYASKVGARGVIEEVRDANVVEDWDVQNLALGQAIIGIPGENPFLFRFDRFENKI
jgi:type IV secretory pathway TraG/TraD family ATPase VirD4